MVIIYFTDPICYLLFWKPPWVDFNQRYCLDTM